MCLMPFWPHPRPKSRGGRSSTRPRTGAKVMQSHESQVGVLKGDKRQIVVYMGVTNPNRFVTFSGIIRNSNKP